MADKSKPTTSKGGEVPPSSTPKPTEHKSEFRQYLEHHPEASSDLIKILVKIY